MPDRQKVVPLGLSAITDWMLAPAGIVVPEQSADTLGMEEGVPVGEGTGTPVVVGIGEGDDLFGTFFEILSFRLVVVAPSASLRSAISPLLNVVACSRAMELCVGELPRIAVGDPPGMNAVKAVKTENDKNIYRTRIGLSSPEPVPRPREASPHPVPEALGDVL